MGTRISMIIYIFLSGLATVIAYDPQFCVGKTHGSYWPDSYDCQGYYNCDRGRTFHYMCPLGAVWNQALPNCDHPYNVDCEKQHEQIYNETMKDADDILPGAECVYPADTQIGAVSGINYDGSEVLQNDMVHLMPKYIVHQTGFLVAFYYRAYSAGKAEFHVYRQEGANTKSYKLQYHSQPADLTPVQGQETWTMLTLSEGVKVKENDVFGLRLFNTSSIRYTTAGLCSNGDKSLVKSFDTITNNVIDFDDLDTKSQSEVCRSYAFGAFVDVNADLNCELLISGTEFQSFESHPGYASGENYPNNYEKCWVIRANCSDDQLTLISDNPAKLEDSENCQKDYLQVNNGVQVNNSAEKLCGEFDLGDHTTNTTYIYIYMHTDSNGTESGFQFQYQSSENGTVDVRADPQTGLHPSEIAAIVLGTLLGLALLAIAIFLIWFCCCKKRRCCQRKDKVKPMDNDSIESGEEDEHDNIPITRPKTPHEPPTSHLPPLQHAYPVNGATRRPQVNPWGAPLPPPIVSNRDLPNGTSKKEIEDEEYDRRIEGGRGGGTGHSSWVMEAPPAYEE